MDTDRRIYLVTTVVAVVAAAIISLATPFDPLSRITAGATNAAGHAAGVSPVKRASAADGAVQPARATLL